MANIKQDGIAEYVRIQLALQSQIDEGILGHSERLPSDKDLAAAYGVSIGTVIKAITNLVNTGYLTRMQGKGTFVNDVFLPPASKRYFRLRTDLAPGGCDLPIRMKMYFTKQVPDLNAVFEGRKLFAPDTPGYILRRSMYDQGQCMVHSIMLLSQIVCPNLDKVLKDELEHRSIHWLLREKYNLESRMREELVKVGMPGDPVLKYFELGGEAPDQPYLLMETRDFLGADTPFIYHLVVSTDRRYGIYREF